MPLLSDACLATLLAGDVDAQTWVDTLPSTLEHVLRTWELTFDSPIYGGHTGCVAAVHHEELGDCVVKIVCDKGLYRWGQDSIEALSASGAIVAALAFSDEHQAVLLPRLVPGQPANSGFPVDQLAALLRRLHASPPKQGLPSCNRVGLHWLESARLVAIPEDVELLDQAQQALAAMPARPDVTLHGDLSPSNLLDGGPLGWLFIDSEAMVGAVEHDLAGWSLRAQQDATALARCVELTAALGADRSVAMTWLFVFAVVESVNHRVQGFVDQSVRERGVAQDLSILLKG